MKIQITKQVLGYFYIDISFFDLIWSFQFCICKEYPNLFQILQIIFYKEKTEKKEEKKLCSFQNYQAMKVFRYSLLHVFQIYSPDNFLYTKNGDFCSIFGPNWFHMSEVTVPLVMHNSEIVLHSGAVNVHFRHGSV